nr:hypothetical protein [Oedogonium sp. 244]
MENITDYVLMGCIIKPPSTGNESLSKQLRLNVQKILNISQEPFYVCEAYNVMALREIRKQSKLLSGVYGWFCKQTNMVYIGGAKDLSKRPFVHLSLLNMTNKHLYNSLRRYGRDEFLYIIFEIIGPSSVITKEQRNDRENFYLASIVSKYNFLEKASSSDGYKHSPDVIERIRQMRLGTKLSKETREKLSKLFSGEMNPFFGKKHSDEFKKSLSESRKGSKNPMYGKQFSPEFLAYQTKKRAGKNNHMSKAIQLINLDTNEKIYCESQTEAGKFLGYQSKIPIQKAVKNHSILKTKNGNRWQVKYTSQ